MHLFLLHEIFPSGPMGAVLAAFLLLIMLIPVVALVLAIVGLLVVARAERLCARSPWLRRAVVEGPRPSVRLCLFVITACVMGGVLSASNPDGDNPLAKLLLAPGLMLPGYGAHSVGPLLMLGVLVSGVFWSLAITGVRALIPAWRGRTTAPVA